ncbi:MAG TPA: hypothetical protein VF550_14805, partial [Polyangia bacterium]
ASADAGIAPGRDGGFDTKRDAVSIETLVSSLASDAPAYKGDACVGCSGGNAGSKGGAGGSSGAAGSGVSGGAAAGGGMTSVGGASGLGGSTTGGSGKGGSPGTGGSIGSGGATSRYDAGIPSSDASPRFDDAAPDIGVSADAGARDAGSDVGVASPDGLAGEVRSTDSLAPDATPVCVAQIEAVVPATDSFKDFYLVAGPNQQVVLRAKIISGGPAAGARWNWQAYRDGAIIVPRSGTLDPASAAFFLSSGGTYSFTATDTTGACSATVQNNVDAVGACPACGFSLQLRFAPPANTDIPVQSIYYTLAGSQPFSQSYLPISSGVAVQVAPSVGSGLVASYIRINSSGGDLVVDGLSDPRTGGFATRLLDQGVGKLLRYDVLVVPVDSTNDGTVPAPQLFPNLTPVNINNTSFSLGGGVAVTGSTVTSAGPIADVRVMLTNQDPAVAQPSKLIFSSVGRSDAQGNYLLHAQPGTYWVSFSPPAGSGLPEALAPTSVTLTVDTTINFKWDLITASTLVLNVLDAAGNPSAQTRVRLTSAQAQPVGTLTSTSSGGVVKAQTANGNVQVESKTSITGVATFTNLPDNASYDALLVPATLGPSSATTTIPLTLPKGGATLPARLSAQGRITGQLTAGKGSTTIDWTLVDLIAYDRSEDSPEIPLEVGATSDGSFSMGVSPGRSYVVLVVPDTSSGLARTFFGPGPLQASEFPLTQNVQAAMAWSSTVMDGAQNGLAGTAMQAFCIVGWPYCVDPTIPLAETTSGDGGAFQFALPDPATR